MKSQGLFRKIAGVAVFAIAMGLLEAAVVAYLRLLYYPQGFYFPLKILPPSVFWTEYLRELATLAMLFSIACLMGKTFHEKTAYFLMTFAMWDIFYYVWLKALLNWPITLLDWDKLFLIPITWVGPVLSPLICSLVMILMAGLVIHFINKGLPARFKPIEWAMILGGAFIIFLTFIHDYSRLIIQGGYLPRLSTLANDLQFQAEVARYVPSDYHWSWFAAGITLILIATVLFARRYFSTLKNGLKNSTGN